MKLPKSFQIDTLLWIEKSDGSYFFGKIIALKGLIFKIALYNARLTDLSNIDLDELRIDEILIEPVPRVSYYETYDCSGPDWSITKRYVTKSGDTTFNAVKGDRKVINTETCSEDLQEWLYR